MPVLSPLTRPSRTASKAEKQVSKSKSLQSAKAKSKALPSSRMTKGVRQTLSMPMPPVNMPPLPELRTTDYKNREYFKSNVYAPIEPYNPLKTEWWIIPAIILIGIALAKLFHTIITTHPLN